MSEVLPREGPLGEARSLGSQIRSGLGLSLLNTLVGRIGTLAVGIVLARLLVPEDYGLYAVALVVLNGLLSVNELGVSLAIVRWPDDPRRVAPTVTTVALSCSLALYGLCYVLAPVLAATLNAPAATPLLRVLCLSVLIDGVTSVPEALLTRAFKQGRRLGADVASLVVSAGVSVSLAIQGMGAWSLVWGLLAGNIVSAVMILFLAPARPRPGFDRSQARALFAFGVPLAGSSLLVFAMLNLDYIVVGRVLGATSLGLYLLAFNISSWPVNVFSVATRRVSLAGFSRLQDDPAALSEGLNRSMGLLLAVTMPVCVLLASFAAPLVRFVYGPRWAASAAPLAFLALLAMLRVALELVYDFLVAVGRSRTVLRLQTLWVLLLAPALYVGGQLGGIRGVAIAHVAVAGGVVAPAFLLALRPSGVQPSALARRCALPILGSGLAAAVALAVQQVVDPVFWQLAVGGLAATGAYALTVLPWRHRLTDPVRKIVTEAPAPS